MGQYVFSDQKNQQKHWSIAELRRCGGGNLKGFSKELRFLCANRGYQSTSLLPTCHQCAAGRVPLKNHPDLLSFCHSAIAWRLFRFNYCESSNVK